MGCHVIYWPPPALAALGLAKSRGARPFAPTQFLFAIDIAIYTYAQFMGPKHCKFKTYKLAYTAYIPRVWKFYMSALIFAYASKPTAKIWIWCLNRERHPLTHHIFVFFLHLSFILCDIQNISAI